MMLCFDYSLLNIANKLYTTKVCIYIYSPPSTNSKQQTNNKRQTTNNKRQTTNNKRQTTNDKQQTTNDKRQTTNNKQQTTNDERQTTNKQQHNNYSKKKKFQKKELGTLGTYACIKSKLCISSEL
jgi:hypothetical protein